MRPATTEEREASIRKDAEDWRNFVFGVVFFVAALSLGLYSAWMNATGPDMPDGWTLEELQEAKNQMMLDDIQADEAKYEAAMERRR